MDPGKPSMSGLELNSNLKDPHSSKQGGWCTLLRSRTAEARQAVWSATWDVLQSQAKCERRFRLATVLTVRALIIKGVDRPTIAKAQFALSEQQSQYIQDRGKIRPPRDPVAPGIRRRASLTTFKHPMHDSKTNTPADGTNSLVFSQSPAYHWQQSRYRIEDRHDSDLLRDSVLSSIRRATSNPATKKTQQTTRLNMPHTGRPVSQQLSPRHRRASSVF